MKKIFLIFLTMITMFSMVGCSNSNPEERMGEIETRPIKSCILSSDMEQSACGAFILGVSTYVSGSTRCVDYYVYVKGVEGYRLQKLDFNKVEIVETNEVEPSIKGYFSEMGKIYNNVYDIECYNSMADSRNDFEKFTNYILYVPEGTIKQEFNADIKDALQ